MARYVLVLGSQGPLRGALEGVGPGNRDFFGPEMVTSEASAICAQKVWCNSSTHRLQLFLRSSHWSSDPYPSQPISTGLYTWKRERKNITREATRLLGEWGGGSMRRLHKSLVSSILHTTPSKSRTNSSPLDGTRDTYYKRQATQHGCLPRLLGDGDKEIESVWWGKKIFCAGMTRACQGRPKISCTGTTSPTNQPRKDPLHLSSLRPHSRRGNPYTGDLTQEQPVLPQNGGFCNSRITERCLHNSRKVS